MISFPGVWVQRNYQLHLFAANRQQIMSQIQTAKGILIKDFSIGQLFCGVQMKCITMKEGLTILCYICNILLYYKCNTGGGTMHLAEKISNAELEVMKILWREEHFICTPQKNPPDKFHRTDFLCSFLCNFQTISIWHCAIARKSWRS